VRIFPPAAAAAAATAAAMQPWEAAESIAVWMDQVADANWEMLLFTLQTTGHIGVLRPSVTALDHWCKAVGDEKTRVLARASGLQHDDAVWEYVEFLHHLVLLLRRLRLKQKKRWNLFLMWRFGMRIRQFRALNAFDRMQLQQQEQQWWEMQEQQWLAAMQQHEQLQQQQPEPWRAELQQWRAGLQQQVQLWEQQLFEQQQMQQGEQQQQQPDDVHQQWQGPWGPW
jgi:hypothetical protein